MSEEVSRRLDAIGMKGQSLTLKIMERDPSAPVEASKVCDYRLRFVHGRFSRIWVLVIVYGTRTLLDVQ
jgi:hypothetical protein